VQENIATKPKNASLPGHEKTASEEAVHRVMSRFTGQNQAGQKLSGCEVVSYLTMVIFDVRT
jgi:hypothetical protein